MKKIVQLVIPLVFSTLLLGACTQNKKTESSETATQTANSVAIILGFGGVDDKSFNQSGWEGLQAWGQETDLTEGIGGYMFIETNDNADNIPNINQALDNDFQTIISLSYLQSADIKDAAIANPDTNFGIVDDVIEGVDNVASATFKDQESAYLAGIAAAYTTETNKVGFIGGIEGPVIARFEAGFRQGVADGGKQLGKSVDIIVTYAGSYEAPDLGKANAASMYQSGADIIYHAAGSTGAGVFQEARAINEAGSDTKVWVIGVDSDQSDEGNYTAPDGTSDNCTLASTIKGVGTAVRDMAQRAADGDFPGGQELVYGLADEGIDLTTAHLDKQTKEAVAAAKAQIITNEITVNEQL